MVVYSADVVIKAIDGYYDDLLGREPTDGEVRSYLTAYRANPSIDAIRTGIARSPEARDAVAALFRDVLDRDADPDSLERLQQQLVGGASLDDVREKLQGSVVIAEEPGEEPPSPSEVRDAVNGLYQDVLGRDADGPALEGWQQAVSRGAPLAGLRAVLATSGEARGVVGGLYGDVLGREADDAGLRFFQGVLAGDGASLGGVRAALAASNEARLVLGSLYKDVLGREGDMEGLDFWQGALAAGNAELDDIRALFASLAEAAGGDVASVQETPASMAFLVLTQEPTPLPTLSGSEAASLASQVAWHPASFSPSLAAGLSTALPASAEVLAGAPLPSAAGVPPLLTGLPDPLSVPSPVAG